MNINFLRIITTYACITAIAIKLKRDTIIKHFVLLIYIKIIFNTHNGLYTSDSKKSIINLNYHLFYFLCA